MGNLSTRKKAAGIIGSVLVLCVIAVCMAILPGVFAPTASLPPSESLSDGDGGPARLPHRPEKQEALKASPIQTVPPSTSQP